MIEIDGEIILRLIYFSFKVILYAYVLKIFS